MGRVFWIIPGALNLITNVLMRGKQREFDLHKRKRHRHTGKRPHEHKAEIRAMWSSMRTWRRQEEPSPITSEGARPRGHPDFKVLLPRTVREYIYFV